MKQLALGILLALLLVACQNPEAPSAAYDYDLEYGFALGCESVNRSLDGVDTHGQEFVLVLDLSIHTAPGTPQPEALPITVHDAEGTELHAGNHGFLISRNDGLTNELSAFVHFDPSMIPGETYRLTIDRQHRHDITPNEDHCLPVLDDPTINYDGDGWLIEWNDVAPENEYEVTIYDGSRRLLDATTTEAHMRFAPEDPAAVPESIHLTITTGTWPKSVPAGQYDATFASASFADDTYALPAP